MALGGTPLAFALDAFSFLVSAACLLPLFNLRAAFRLQPKVAERDALADLREGLGAVFGSAWVWVTIAVAGLSNITYAGPMEVGLPFLIKERRGEDVAVLGLFYSSSSLGSVLAAAWLGRLARLRRRGLTLYASWLCIGLMVALIGLRVPLPVLLTAGLVIGACNSILSLAWVSALQEKIPPGLLGRVSSVDYLGSYLLLPVGFSTGGWAIERFGVAAVFIPGCTSPECSLLPLE